MTPTGNRQSERPSTQGDIAIELSAEIHRWSYGPEPVPHLVNAFPWLAIPVANTCTWKHALHAILDDALGGKCNKNQRGCVLKWGSEHFEGLTSRPFMLSPDPDFFQVEQALKTMLYLRATYTSSVSQELDPAQRAEETAQGALGMMVSPVGEAST